MITYDLIDRPWITTNLRNLRRIMRRRTMRARSLSCMDHTDRPGDVADPWYTGDFEATWRDVLEGCDCTAE